MGTKCGCPVRKVPWVLSNKAYLCRTPIMTEYKYRVNMPACIDDFFKKYSLIVSTTCIAIKIITLDDGPPMVVASIGAQTLLYAFVWLSSESGRRPWIASVLMAWIARLSPFFDGAFDHGYFQVLWFLAAPFGVLAHAHHKRNMRIFSGIQFSHHLL